MQTTLKNRTIFCRDNVEVLEGLNSASVDLIYLDPPFNKNKIFSAPSGSSAGGASFKDIFREEDLKEEWLQEIKEEHYDLHHFLIATRAIEGRRSYNFCYLAYMAIRLMQCHRGLKDTGCLYLHCDSTMSHYLKLLLDCIFGEANFRNEIIWQRNDKRGKGSQHAPKKFGANTDTILFYSKSNTYTLSPYLDADPMRKILKGFVKRDENGRVYMDVKALKDFDEKALKGFNGIDENERQHIDLKTLKKFKNIDEKERIYKTGTPLFRSLSMGPRPNLCFEWRGHKNPHPSGWRLSKEMLEAGYQKGNVVRRSSGRLERREYLKDYKGLPIDNNWTDIPRVSGKVSIKYPTRKPLALLERIIEASSKPGDLVVDPFCGCATTCVAAEKLGRRWIGIDVSHEAYELVKARLAKEIARTDELFWGGKITFQTDPPKRTDTEDYLQKQKYVYIISNAQYLGEFKVGIASNVKSRLNSYQTGDPNRAYKLEYKFQTPYFREIERFIHDKYQNKHEWVRGDIEAIRADIKNFR